MILVGHSYGGMVITGAAARAPERLAHLVYLDAFVPEDGQALTDFQPPERRQAMEDRVRAEGEGWLLPSLLPMPWDDFVRDVYGVADEDDRRWMVARLGPQPFKTFIEPVQRTNPAAALLPRTYIRCLLSPTPAFDRRAAIAQEAGSGWRYRGLATGHDAMVTMPRELTDLLLELA